MHRLVTSLIAGALLITACLASAQQYGDFIYSAPDGSNIVILAYTGSGGPVVIPDSINSHPVIAIGPAAFSNQTAITSVTIPDSVKVIYHSAFSGCSNLIAAAIGNGVTTIGVSAFQNCTRLIAVTIPDSTATIGDSAFSNCASTM